MNPPNDPEKVKDIVKKVLAEHLGVEPEDINDDDSFNEDLHMNPSELVDFSEKLEALGYDISKIDLMSLEKVEDLVDALSSH